MLVLAVQKYVVIGLLAALNILLSFTFGFHPDYWFAFMFALALGTAVNSLSVICILWEWMFSKKTPERTVSKSLLYIVPCYNESMEELQATLNSLTSQYKRLNDEQCIIIVCDGRVKGNKCTESTDQILLKMLKVNLLDKEVLGTYCNASGFPVNINIYEGFYNSVKCMLIIKNTNQGKRDSITLVRRLAFGESDQVPEEFMSRFCSWIGKLPDYLIGVDADTVFHPMCTEELVKSIESGGEMCKGCVGFIDIPTKLNPFVMYQYAEYHFGQLVRRRAQSEFTHKVNCLSGCNQIIRVCKETCGDELLNLYSKVPTATDTIFTHIRSYASEDRNHVCLMLSMYPYVTTKQSREAIAYTKVPESVPVFLSQRRRWTLGALTNDMLLTYLPDIALLERISAAVNIITFSFNPFIFVATCFFIKAIIYSRNMLMLYLSIPMIVPFVYCLLTVPLTRGFHFREIVYFYISYALFILLGLPVSTLVYINSLLGMDTIKWGKTRQVKVTELEGKDEGASAGMFTINPTQTFIIEASTDKCNVSNGSDDSDGSDVSHISDKWDPEDLKDLTLTWLSQRESFV
jgi:chitin synthase